MTDTVPSNAAIENPSSPMGTVCRIVLTGFMGSGKSTVGPLIAGRLGWPLVDVDDVIVADAGMTISEIFARHGEAALREREHFAHIDLETGVLFVP